MKIIYSFFLFSIIVFSSCSKLDPETKLAGNWKLDDVVKKRLFNNDHLTTGYEAGLFTFNENGTATYTDSIT